VRFQYRGTEPLFENKSITIQGGQKVALLVIWWWKDDLYKSYFRLYELTSGQIFIDGQDISKVTQDSLRNALV